MHHSFTFYLQQLLVRPIRLDHFTLTRKYFHVIMANILASMNGRDIAALATLIGAVPDLVIVCLVIAV